MLKDLFTLSGRWGRLNRLRYFGYGLLSNLVFMLTVMAVLAIGIGGGLGGFLFLMLPLYCALFWVAICLMIKRLHDMNKSGWWVLFLFGFSFLGGFVSGLIPEMESLGLLFNVPAIGFILWLLFWPGTTGDNQYGPDPVERS